MMPPHRYRTVFISDTHLGFRGARADFLLDFLRSTEAQTLYLVGDIVDVWKMERRGLFWPREHSQVLREIVGKAENGTRVVYVPGNHDEKFREFAGSMIHNVEIERQSIHRTADGRRFLVMHGDEFDAAVKCSRLLSALGNHGYDFLLRTNRIVNAVRREFGFPYWSLAAFLKHRVGNAVSYIQRFEEAVAREAEKRGVDGIVAGHIHHAEIRRIGDVLYCNDGDWVESCTALVEDARGTLEIVHWSDAAQEVRISATAA